MRVSKINDTPCDITIGYTWDKGGSEKYICVIDNITKTIYAFGNCYCNHTQKDMQWVDVMGKLSRIYNMAVNKIEYKGQIHKLCHDDDIGTSYKRGFAFKGDWKDF